MTTPSQGGAPRVLVVDDEADSLELLWDILTAEGYRVVTARSGHEALGVMASGALEAGGEEAGGLDAVILDLMMPGLSGFAVLRGQRRLYRRGGGPPPAVIVCSGYPQLIPEALRQGAKYVLEKPFAVERLLTVLQTALGETP